MSFRWLFSISCCLLRFGNEKSCLKSANEILVFTVAVFNHFFLVAVYRRVIHRVKLVMYRLAVHAVEISGSPFLHPVGYFHELEEHLYEFGRQVLALVVGRQQLVEVLYDVYIYV